MDDVEEIQRCGEGDRCNNPECKHQIVLLVEASSLYVYPAKVKEF